MFEFDFSSLLQDLKPLDMLRSCICEVLLSLVPVDLVPLNSVAGSVLTFVPRLLLLPGTLGFDKLDL